MGDDVRSLANHNVGPGPGNIGGNPGGRVLPYITRDWDVTRPRALVHHPINRGAVWGGVRSGGSNPSLPWFLEKDDVSRVHEGIKYSMSDVVSFIYVKGEKGYAREGGARQE